MAVFDLDGTLVAGDAFAGFLLHALRVGQLPRCAGLLPRAVMHACRGGGDGALKSGALRAVLGGMPQGVVAALVSSFPGATVSAVKPAARRRIAWHRARGDLLVMATAGLDIYAEPLARALGLHAVVATRVAWDGDRVSGGLLGPNLKGDAKVAALRGLPAFAAGRPWVTAYTDHHSDLPLLQFADEAVAVDPTRRMQRIAREQGFKVERWAE